MSEEATMVEFSEKFKVCPNCGYADGFHSMFDRMENGRLKWKFICPDCHKIWDIGLTVTAE